MSVGILLRDPVRDFSVEFESLRHREISEIRKKKQNRQKQRVNYSVFETEAKIKLASG